MSPPPCERMGETMLVELSEYELELVKQGLEDHISDFCVDWAEEKPYRTLLDKLNELGCDKC